MLLAMVYVLLAGLSLDLFVAASPLAVPHYSREAFPLYENDRHTLGRSLVSRIPQILTASDLGKRGLGTTEPRDVYNTLVRRYQDVLSSSLQLRALSQDSSVAEPTVVESLTTYKTSISEFQSALAYLGRDKGLANYNKDDKLETLLKDLVNLHKHTLSYIDVVVYQLPVVGPMLGPIVYDIKCILDEVLNAVENISDGLLNVLDPLLIKTVQDTLLSACSLGLSILGICA
ncbi:hypothetical protein AGABI2DRAFT_189622 [Agaricus bisporus var. bisporus H97]|uniref:hypothetical protein n=1 Tax=Agaricus bisporus var. bisporus (strain H97 / ATCC MYA-4626 / FGSC 10389) TaxID=936046 RepID=UPI00029F6942|nr:hypothetical protein AGABI2DRAFT_189622 [Agaricus bisporus var. bisporus H97]EKV51370.1 hypothetical protein AGABI2DRAFT_189622 [Agaricus bisporus var. bisporus H97]